MAVSNSVKYHLSNTQTLLRVYSNNANRYLRIILNSLSQIMFLEGLSHNGKCHIHISLVDTHRWGHSEYL